MSAHFDSSHHAAAHYDSSHYNRGLAVVVTPGGGLEDAYYILNRRMLRRKRREVAGMLTLLSALVAVIEAERDYTGDTDDDE